MTDERSSASTLVPMHIGFAVGDLNQATELLSSLGIGPWALSAWRRTRYWDGTSSRVVEVASRVGFGRLSGGLALELIQSDPEAGDVPPAWEPGLLGGPPHIGYWCADLDAGALELAGQGARLTLTRATEELVTEVSRLMDRPGEVPSLQSTSYFATPTGPMIELVPDSVWSERLPALLGEAVMDILSPPPTR